MKGIGLKRIPADNRVRAAVMAALLIIGVAATYWCHHVLHIEVVFTHLFYLPITLAGIWWGRRGLVVPVFLGVLLLASHAWSSLPGAPLNDLIRALIFLLVGFTVGWLSDLHTRAAGRLVEMNIAKDKFFSIISHDLRSPFQNLMFLSSELCDHTATFSPAQVCEYAQGLCTTSKRLFSLVEDLLEWSRIETGTVERRPELAELTQTVEDVADIYSEYAARKEIRIVREIPEGLMAWVDRNQLRCILRNLISNAIKFTRRGGEVRVTATTDHDLLTVSVADTGVGIPEDMLEKIFRIDVYHTTRGTDNEKGSGLGLVLCKSLVGMNGGSMSVRSVPDHGSTFSFSLPLRKPTPSSAHYAS